MEFNNIEYGIIVEDSSGNRATYLPNVFPNKSWNYIKDSLMSKAGTKQKSKFLITTKIFVFKSLRHVSFATTEVSCKSQL